MLAWVLMPDHAHWLVEVGERGTLSDIVNRLKNLPVRVMQIDYLEGRVFLG